MFMAMSHLLVQNFESGSKMWNSFAVLTFNRGNICFMQGSGLGQDARHYLGSMVVGFPFQEIGAECIIMCLMVKYSIGDQSDEMYGHYSPLLVPPKGLKSLLCNNPKDIHYLACGILESLPIEFPWLEIYRIMILLPF